MDRDPFWTFVDDGLATIRKRPVVDYDGLREVFGKDSQPEVLTDAEVFFPGSGGDDQLIDAIEDAGWPITKMEASYHWTARSPDGSQTIEYVEGDVYLRQ